MIFLYEDDSFKRQIKRLEEIIASNIKKYKESFSPIIISSYLIMKEISPISPEVKKYFSTKKIFIREYEVFTTEINQELNKYIQNEIESYLGALNPNILNLLGISVSEIIENIQQHAFSTKVVAICQNYRLKGIFDIVIYDNGIGFKKSLENAGIKVKDDVEALLKVINEKVSSKKDKLRERAYGLSQYFGLIYNYLHKKNNIVDAGIITNNAVFIVSEKKVYKMKGGVEGTLVFARVDLQKIGEEEYINLDDVLYEEKVSYGGII